MSIVLFAPTPFQMGLSHPFARLWARLFATCALTLSFLDGFCMALSVMRVARPGLRRPRASNRTKATVQTLSRLAANLARWKRFPIGSALCIDLAERSMKFGVRPLVRQFLKVLWSIIERVVILVMNDLRSLDRLARMCLQPHLMSAEHAIRFLAVQDAFFGRYPNVGAFFPLALALVLRDPLPLEHGVIRSGKAPAGYMRCADPSGYLWPARRSIVSGMSLSDSPPPILTDAIRGSVSTSHRTELPTYVPREFDFAGRARMDEFHGILDSHVVAHRTLIILPHGDD